MQRIQDLDRVEGLRRSISLWAISPGRERDKPRTLKAGKTLLSLFTNVQTSAFFPSGPALTCILCRALSGDLVAAKWNDDFWYRACVLEVRDGDLAARTPWKAHVHFVDHGNTAWLSATRYYCFLFVCNSGFTSEHFCREHWVNLPVTGALKVAADLNYRQKRRKKNLHTDGVILQKVRGVKFVTEKKHKARRTSCDCAFNLSSLSTSSFVERGSLRAFLYHFSLRVMPSKYKTYPALATACALHELVPSDQVCFEVGVLLFLVSPVQAETLLLLLNIRGGYRGSNPNF